MGLNMYDQEELTRGVLEEFCERAACQESLVKETLRQASMHVCRTLQELKGRRAAQEPSPARQADRHQYKAAWAKKNAFKDNQRALEAAVTALRSGHRPKGWGKVWVTAASLLGAIVSYKEARGGRSRRVLVTFPLDSAA
jgi:hypothetical protein